MSSSVLPGAGRGRASKRRRLTIWAPAFAGGTMLLMAAAAAQAGTPVSLKADPADMDGTVTLGDLFDGAGRAENVPVAAGPKPGLSTVLDASKVQVAAARAGLTWGNEAAVRRVIVRSGAAAGAPSAGPAASVQAAATETLVYARSLAAGEIVGPDDLVWAPARAAADAPSDADAVIGLAAKKPLRAGTAVSARDLSAPRVISKNDMIAVSYKSGGVTLTLQAKAVTGGAVGQSITVLNLQSKKMVEAVAFAPGQALVGPEADRLKAAALTNPTLVASLR